MKQLTASSLDFLRLLSKNNNRQWFAENKHLYDAARHEFELFTAQLIEICAKIDPSLAHLKAKDCIYRIYRDVRFSHNKSPYKVNFCCAIIPDGRNGRLPGYFFSLEPGGQSFAGGGVYCADKADTERIRREICNFPEDFIAAVENAEFTKRMHVYDELKLKKFPSGYDNGFAGDEYLKLKSWCATHVYTDDECLRADFALQVAEDFALSTPLNNFLRRALDAPEEEHVDF